jgi:predicted phosphodiesterase
MQSGIRRAAAIIAPVRLLLLSDIHSNLEALEACLDAAPAYDRVANLGDVVGYGGSPNQTVELVRALEPIHVRGNHDRVCSGVTTAAGFNPLAAEAARWTQRELSGRNLDWLRQLPEGPVCDSEWQGVQMVHGSPLDEDTYLSSAGEADAAMEHVRCPLTFFGHTHLQSAFAQALTSTTGKRRNRTERLVPEEVPNAGSAQLWRITLDDGHKYMVNPGSVGQPRDRDWRAAFAVYDSDSREVTFYRVPYDVAGAQRRILEAGLPKALAMRLEVGR